MKQYVRLWAPLILAAMAPYANADERIVNFWRPGQMGSMAAVPAAPGWSLPVVYVNMAVDTTDSRNLAPGIRLDTDLKSRANLVFLAPNYTFERSLWGGRPSIGLGIGAGRTRTTVDAALHMPGGITITGMERDALTALADVFPIGNVKWNDGAHNYMAYVSGVVPVGSYRQTRLANTGANRWAVDAGGAYTYFDLKKRMEFSIVGGLSYKGRNADIDYRSGTEAHIDWTTSYFILPNVHAGLAGYFYRQLKADSGSGALVHDVKSRVNGIGPQAGMYFPVGGHMYYLNAKAFHEWGAKNRGEGWNFWLSLIVPLTGK
ncbi:transporter [Pantoea sp. 18069]|uniref:SphA family protein n=1 Tax=Pantoea sp. 18069 TaxID=2681415 RepID=UPI00135822DE|nr:transporter [Pantoea sp. 18069]